MGSFWFITRANQGWCRDLRCLVLAHNKYDRAAPIYFGGSPISLLEKKADLFSCDGHVRSFGLLGLLVLGTPAVQALIAL